ncbi:MAG TPA: ATPase domain-containing protein [Candidatus Sulfotelmatobacter sp.]
MAAARPQRNANPSVAESRNNPADHADPRISSGCIGLDNILNGGFSRDRIYLVEGDPGAGKTTLALQFIRDGVGKGERGLYIALSESHADLSHAAQSHGLSLDGIEIFELLPDEGDLLPEQQWWCSTA